MRVSSLLLVYRPYLCQNAEEFFKEYRAGRLNLQLFLAHLKTPANIYEVFPWLKDFKSPTESLWFHRNKLDESGISTLIPILLDSPNLLHLQLSNNGVKAQQMMQFSQALAVNKHLLSLTLYENGFGDQGAELIANALKYNSSLRVLDLSKNKITNKGLSAVCDALVNKMNSNTSLLFLGLKDNDLDNDCCKPLSHLLTNNSSLMFLDVSDNVIENSGAKELLNAIEFANFTIVEVDFSETDVDDKDLYLQLEGLIQRNIQAPKKALEDALSSAKGPWRRSKLMVIGQGRAGKTATVRSLLGQKFLEEWNSTVGAELTQTKTRAGKGKGGWMAMNQGDIEKYDNEFLTELLVNEAGANLTKMRENKLQRQENTPPIESTVVSQPGSQGLSEAPTGPDLSQINIKVADIIKKLSDDVVLETARSYRDQVIFSIWDYGGQKVFYTLHHLFLTKYGIYLLVFNMEEVYEAFQVAPDSTPRKEAAEDPIEYMSFWLNSCTLHAPNAPILLVGTNLDKMKSESVSAVDSYLKKTFFSGNKYPQVLHRAGTDNAAGPCFFPVDNKHRVGVEELRNTVFDCTAKQDYVNYKVPVFWLSVLDEMNASQTGTSRSFLRLQQVNDIFQKETGILLASQDSASKEAKASKLVKSMLAFFHELGVIVHFTSSTVLEDLVILSPQWVLEAMSQVIRDGQLHMFSTEEMEELKKAALAEDASRMLKQAIVSRDLLEFLWKKSRFLVNQNTNVSRERLELKNVNLAEFFIQLMKKTLLLSEWTHRSKASSLTSMESYYLVPSLLPLSTEAASLQQIAALKEAYTCYCVYDFRQSFLPTGLFQRVVCLSVEYSASNMNWDTAEVPELYDDFAKLMLEKDLVVLIEAKSEEMIVYVKDNVAAASTCLKIIDAIVTKIKNDVMGNGLRWEQHLGTKNSPELIPYAKAKQQKLSPWFGAPVATPSSSGGGAIIDIDTFLDEF